MMGAVLWSSEGGRRKFFFSLVATGVTPSCWPRGPRIVWSSQRNARAKNYKRTHLLKKEEDEKKTRVKVFLGAKEKKKKRILSWWNGHATLKSLLLHFNPTRTEEPRNFCFLGVFTFFFLFFFFVIFKKFPPRGCKRDSAYEAKICIDDFFRFVTTFAPFIIYERAVCKLKKKK